MGRKASLKNDRVIINSVPIALKESLIVAAEDDGYTDLGSFVKFSMKRLLKERKEAKR